MFDDETIMMFRLTQADNVKICLPSLPFLSFVYLAFSFDRCRIVVFDFATIAYLKWCTTQKLSPACKPFLVADDKSVLLRLPESVNLSDGFHYDKRQESDLLL